MHKCSTAIATGNPVLFYKMHYLGTIIKQNCFSHFANVTHQLTHTASLWVFLLNDNRWVKWLWADLRFHITAFFPSSFLKLVKFLVFASTSSDSAPPCGMKGNCSAPTPLPFLPKNPGNQTGNTTAGTKDVKDAYIKLIHDPGGIILHVHQQSGHRDHRL